MKRYTICYTDKDEKIQYLEIPEKSLNDIIIDSDYEFERCHAKIKPTNEPALSSEDMNLIYRYIELICLNYEIANYKSALYDTLILNKEDSAKAAESRYKHFESVVHCLYDTIGIPH